MAGECSYRSGLHVFADVHRIEIVDDDGLVLPAGELGNIVVTDLYNRVHPLIRYQLGDRGMLLDEGCPCGVSLPLMAKPEGRTTDVLRLPSGKIMNHRLFSMFSEFPESVQQFQIHQRADYSIKIKVIPGASPDALSQIDRAVSVLRDRVGGEVEVRTVIVDSLPYVGGKLKYVTSDVPPQEPRHG